MIILSTFVLRKFSKINFTKKRNNNKNLENTDLKISRGTYHIETETNF